MKVLVKGALKIIIISFTILALPHFISGISISGNGYEAFKYALLATLALALVNLLIKPIIKLVTLPINIITLGLFGLVINAVLLLVTAKYVPGFAVTGFVAAFLGALVLSGMNWVVSQLK